VTAPLLDPDGVLHVSGVVDGPRCDAICAAIERSRSRVSEFYGVLSPAGDPQVDSDLFVWPHDDEYRSLVADGPLARLASALLDAPNVVFVEDQWFVSAPGAATPSPWHQDGPYYNLDRPFLTLWLALDDAPPEAALRVVAGSHRAGAWYAPVEFSTTLVTTLGSTALPPVPDVDADPSADVRHFDVRRGDVVALHSDALHAAGGVALPTVFRRLSTRWAHPDTRYVDRGPQVASFWRQLPHGLRDGDLLACDQFPLIAAGTSS
jgi:hypothetical protein